MSKLSMDLDTKKEVAKLGMTTTMGITVATAMFMKNKTMKKLHIGAGVALVAFSYWHHTLYDKKPRTKRVKKTLQKKTQEVSE